MPTAPRTVCSVSVLWSSKSECFWIAGIHEFYIRISVHHKSIIYNKPTRCNSGSIVFINNYKYAPHSWFQTFAVIWILYMFFWVFPRRQIVVGRRFRTLYQFHLQDGTDTGFRNVGQLQFDAGEIPKRTCKICCTFFGRPLRPSSGAL